MKTRRFKAAYRKGASSLHKEMGECLRNSSLFKAYRVYQEYPVTLIAHSFPNRKCHYDWVIPDLYLVIELQGRQHFEATSFGGPSEDGGVSNLQGIRTRDKLKKQAAIEAGWTYIEFSYKDRHLITDELVLERYRANKNNLEVEKKDDKLVEVKPIQAISPRRERGQQAVREKQLSKHKAYRQEAYRRAKIRKQSREQYSTES